jgi:hypothetical protein
VTPALTVTALLIVGVAAFFAWANRLTRKAHASFTRQDVEGVLEAAIGASDYYDDWDLFLGSPIDDPYLDSVRQRCIQISDQYGGPAPGGAEFVARLKPILEELKNRQ